MMDLYHSLQKWEETWSWVADFHGQANSVTNIQAVVILRSELVLK